MTRVLTRGAIVAAAMLLAGTPPPAVAQKAAASAPSSATAAAGPKLETSDIFVPWVSTVPIDAGQMVGLHVRHKTASGGGPRPAVLFVHGATGPSVPDFDLDYKDYNWMAKLAGAGFDTYAIDLYGYGSSPRPGMDDPCNASAKQQQDILMNRPLGAACPPSYPFNLTTINHEWQQIDAVVDYIRRTTRHPRIHIVGWSAGGPRVGGYVSQHPDKIDRVVLYAPSPTIPGLALPERPTAGNPLFLQTKEALMHGRWAADEKCAGQVDPGIRAAVWTTTLDWDRIGRSWGPEGEGVMRSPVLKDFGWSPAMAARITAPTLVVVGEFDRLQDRHTVFEQLGSPQKVFLRVACASHFMVWEKQHVALQDMSLEWLRSGTAAGQRAGELRADEAGKLTKAP